MKITTEPDGHFNLDYSDHIPQMEQVRRQVAEAIARDTDGKMRKALIDMGWMPPPISGRDSRQKSTGSITSKTPSLSVRLNS